MVAINPGPDICRVAGAHAEPGGLMPLHLPSLPARLWPGEWKR